MEEAPWRRNHGGGILEEESWSRYPAWGRNHGGRIWGASGTHLEASEGAQNARRRHPGGTQEAPRGTQATQEASGGLRFKK